MIHSEIIEFGTAFYHLNQSLIPENIVIQLNQADGSVTNNYDEFGFVLTNNRTDIELRDDNESIRLQRKQEYIEHKAKWVKYLELEYQKLAPKSYFDLSKFDTDIDRTAPTLNQLISSGPITNELRPFFWLRLSRALKVKASAKFSFAELSEISLNNTSLTDLQVSQVLPANVCFASATTVGARRLKQILRIIKWYEKVNSSLTVAESEFDTSLVTQQLNLSLIGAYFLLVCSEEESFWILSRLSTESNIADCVVIVKKVLGKCCPTVADLLCKHDIEFELIAANWFATLFAGFVTNTHLLFAIWDLYFYEGPIFLVQFTIGLLVIESKKLETHSDDSAELFNALSDLPSNAFRCDRQGWWAQSERLLTKVNQAWKAGKNVVSNLQSLPPALFNYERSAMSLPNSSSLTFCSELYTQGEQRKLKNVIQTQLLMNLHEAVVALAHHFQAYDLDAKYRLEPEFDEPTKTNGINSKNDNFNANNTRKMNSSRRASLQREFIEPTNNSEDIQHRLRPYQRRRAKALLDFECNESDELGFRKNDIITIVNEKDEHCWIGELNSHIGWFPAKFVELLDERDLDYSAAGDDRVVPFVNDLVRGRLCSALKTILTYDLRRTSYFVATHPWTVIEEISNQVTNGGDFKQIYSRLVLTKTFRLDEYSQVLSPGELLYRSIAAVNKSYSANTPLDVKLRSLICMGLNQYVLHEWFQLICISQPSIIARHYGPNSFLSTPVWKLIKAELKLLVQFSFHLNPNAELPPEPCALHQQPQPKSPVTKEGVWDMLIKYHLFSWDI